MTPGQPPEPGGSAWAAAPAHPDRTSKPVIHLYYCHHHWPQTGIQWLWHPTDSIA
jgi:hypothetical protein